MENLSNFRRQILIELIEDRIFMERNINDVEGRPEDEFLIELELMLNELNK